MTLRHLAVVAALILCVPSGGASLACGPATHVLTVSGGDGDPAPVDGVGQASRAAGLLAFAAPAGGASTDPAAAARPTDPAPAEVATDGDEPEPDATPKGLVLSLHEGAPTVEPRDGLPTEPAPLPLARWRELMARLPEPLPGVDGDGPALVLPPVGRPPDRTGLEIAEPFPPSAGPPRPETDTPAALRVMRVTPEGDSDVVTVVSVTFDQPMVPLADLDAREALDVPVRLEPQPPGAWRWVDPRTLVFEPDDRMPMATRSRVRVPAGTTSAVGGRLAEDHVTSFTTPAPQITGQLPAPGQGCGREPVIALAFDQRVVPADVLPHLDLRVDGWLFDSDIALRLAEPDAVTEDLLASLGLDGERADHAVVLRAEEPLPAGAELRLVARDGCPSAEGPRRTERDQLVSFRSFGPLELVDSSGTADDPLWPGRTLALRFNNVLDEDQPLEGLVDIAPATPRAPVVSRFGNNLLVWADFAAASTYRVTVAGHLRDAFGQTLGEPASVPVVVRSHPPSLAVAGSALTVLDPFAAPALTLDTRNVDAVDVVLRRVEPADWPAWQRWYASGRREGAALPDGLGQVVARLEVRPEDRPEEVVRTLLGLAGGLPGDTGHLLVQLGSDDVETRWLDARWLQRTRLGVDVAVEGRRMLVLVTSLLDGSPVPGAQVALGAGDGATDGATTASDGTAWLDLPPSGSPLQVLVARHQGDSVLIPESRWAWDTQPRSDWDMLSPTRRVLWHVFDDRGTYRPGETVRIKGWLRSRREYVGPDEGVIPTGAVSYTLQGPRRQEWATGEVTLDAFGGFDLELALPADADPGQARLRLEAAALAPAADRDTRWMHPLTVAEFRRPEYEVTVGADLPEAVVGEDLRFSALAAYYTGGPLPDADVMWDLRATPSSYAPPGWDDFSFGTWRPWWGGGWGGDEPSGSWSFEGRTDAGGEHHLRVALTSMDPPQPMQLRVEAGVTDVNAQRWVGSASRLVHPSEAYVGLACERPFVRRGETLTLRHVVVDREGAVLAGRPVTLRVARLVWQRGEQGWSQVEQDATEQSLVSADAPGATPLEFADGGSWRVTLTTEDAAGRANRSSRSLWVAGGDGPPPVAGVPLQELELVPAAREFAPGDAAEVLVSAPFTAGEGLATLSAGDLRHVERFTLVDGSAVLSLPVGADAAPGLRLRVDVVGQTVRVDPDGTPRLDLPPRPAQATAELWLAVRTDDERLQLAVAPEQAETMPGAETRVDVTVTDADGDPVSGAQVCLFVADEAVLALGPYTLSDPLSSLLPAYREYDLRHRLRPMVVLSDPTRTFGPGFEALSGDAEPEPGEAPSAPELSNTDFDSLQSLGYLGDGDAYAGKQVRGLAAAAPAAMAVSEAVADPSGAASAPIALRTRFDALAAFVPDLVSDDGGRVTATFTLPDSLTRYRVMAVAVHGARRAGHGRAALTARLPLMVRPSPPRMLNLDDALGLPVVLQNGTDEPMRVDLAVAASGLWLPVVDGAGPGGRVTVPARDRVEVLVPVTADRAGRAALAFVAVDADDPSRSDAARVGLPVLTPATREAFAVYGSLADGVAVQPVQAPADARPGFGGLELTTSSTAFAGLTDAVLQVTSYPYGCAEQRASRVLATLAVDDVLAAFDAPGLPDPVTLRESLTADLEQLVQLQDGSGGFPFWPRGRVSPFVTVHVTHALVRAAAEDRPVPAEALSRALDWLADVRGHLASLDPRLPTSSERTIRAYAAWVLQLAGRDASDAAADLLDEGGAAGLDGESLAWLYPVLAADAAGSRDAADVRRELMNRVTVTARGAELALPARDDGHWVLRGDRRASCLLLSALLDVEPDSDLVPRLVASLQAHRSRGHWGTTQENVFALLALGRAFERLEADEPDFTAGAWLGDRAVAEVRFSGRSTDRHTTVVPVDLLGEALGGERGDVVLRADGPGRLTWRLGLRYARVDAAAMERSAGFTVERSYEAVEHPDDVRRDDDGTWRIRRGAMVRVRLTLVAPATRYHVALVDRLPGGLEPLDEGLAVTGSLPGDEQDDGDAGWFWRCFWWGATWYEHQSLRDAGAETFASRLPAGVHRTSYVTRATAPGSFVAPSAHAEEMYAPEVFGRSAAQRVVIE